MHLCIYSYYQKRTLFTQNVSIIQAPGWISMSFIEVSITKENNNNKKIGILLIVTTIKVQKQFYLFIGVVFTPLSSKIAL